jgi:GNAT superfamily N-acetyltransferase
MLNFPRAINLAAARRGVDAARERGACIVGAWLASDVDASPLETAGFERGWEPWWMAAALESITEPDDQRVSITADVPEYGPDGQRLLSLADAPDARAFHAVARVDGRFAGRAWAFAPADVAGIYDMDVWPPFQRRGLGRALLRRLSWSARAAGAEVAVLNATPDGHRLYSVEGFARIGTGVTYWHHLA